MNPCMSERILWRYKWLIGTNTRTLVANLFRLQDGFDTVAYMIDSKSFELFCPYVNGDRCNGVLIEAKSAVLLRNLPSLPFE